MFLLNLGSAPEDAQDASYFADADSKDNFSAKSILLLYICIVIIASVVYRTITLAISLFEPMRIGISQVCAPCVTITWGLPESLWKCP